MDKPLKSLTHGQYDARPIVTFPVAEHRRPLAGTKLYCLVTGTWVLSTCPESLPDGVPAGSRTTPLDHGAGQIGATH